MKVALSWDGFPQERLEGLRETLAKYVDAVITTDNSTVHISYETEDPTKAQVALCVADRYYFKAKGE